eukprot:TRINITY_DN3908_c0_g2_i1.p1 TRINITY_DN3908_c0_g2~~TRINITY_DN3908_c0_g2_i1.p1  ORF type:complete len:165 (-),score=14.29 TRINITY_DN3908_c0_g2_i1:289-717(-)
MVLNEVLRLYPPAPLFGRTCVRETKIGENIVLPKGCDFIVPTCYIHRKESLWGPDAHLFNPERFRDGISKAGTHPMAFLPFGVGERTCLGQNFAFLEARVTLAVLLQSVQWRLAPGYRHGVEVSLTVRPMYGMPVIMKKVGS